jgi:Ni,Fe-hydrogenase maturation factor
MGLSDPVEAAIEHAVNRIEALVNEILDVKSM